MTDTEMPFDSQIATQPAASNAVNECKEVSEQPATDEDLYPYLMLAIVAVIWSGAIVTRSQRSSRPKLMLTTQSMETRHDRRIWMAHWHFGGQRERLGHRFDLPASGWYSHRDAAPSHRISLSQVANLNRRSDASVQL
jgi:hypothetical protein